jgi:hypothetical protein
MKKFIKSETILIYEKANYRFEDSEKEGVLIITEFRGIFMYSIPEEDNIYFHLLGISKIEKSNDKKSAGKYFLEIATKDNRSFKYYIIKDDQQKIYQHLLKYDNPKEIVIYYKFAIKYRESHPVNYDGWEKYEPIQEFSRQGLDFQSNLNEVFIKTEFRRKD